MYIIVSSFPIKWGGVFLLELILVIAQLDWKDIVLLYDVCVKLCKCLLYIEAYCLIQVEWSMWHEFSASAEGVMYYVHILYLCQVIIYKTW